MSRTNGDKESSRLNSPDCLQPRAVRPAAGSKGQPSCRRGPARSRQRESARGVARPVTQSGRIAF